jgi:hypothetical protein
VAARERPPLDLDAVDGMQSRGRRPSPSSGAQAIQSRYRFLPDDALR